jgi:hypothetical protein
MAFAVHFIVDPFPSILLPVIPAVSPAPKDLVHLEISIVERTISKRQLAFSVFLPLSIVAFIYSAIRPRLGPKAVLLVIFPFALVLGTIGMNVRSLAIGLVIAPLAFVDIPISVV